MIFSYLLNMQSHPSWVCGLKRIAMILIIALLASHPSWVCGLKPIMVITNLVISRHTLRGCVD